VTTRARGKHAPITAPPEVEAVTITLPRVTNDKRAAATRARREAAAFYDGWSDARLYPISRDEKVVIAHLRGWAHFGPLCRMCKAEADYASLWREVNP